MFSNSKAASISANFASKIDESLHENKFANKKMINNSKLSNYILGFNEMREPGQWMNASIR